MKLTKDEIEVLNLIDDKVEDPITISDRLEVDLTVVEPVIGMLEANGLVTKTEKDRKVIITSLGKKVLKEHKDDIHFC